MDEFVSDYIGADQAVPGSNWRHLGGAPQPMDLAAQLNKLETRAVRRIMRDNGLQPLNGSIGSFV